MKVEELKGLLDETMSPKVEELVTKAVVTHMEPANQKLDEVRKDSVELRNLLLEQYNRGTINRPFKKISPEAEEYIEKIWRPLLKKEMVSREDAEQIVQKTTSTISQEGVANQGGFTVPEEF